MAEVKVTLAHKKNLRDAEAKKPELLNRIKTASGVDYTFEMEPTFEELVISLIKGGSKYHENVGGAMFNQGGYLENATKLFEKACKDDMIKEAIVEATPNKKIILKVDPALDSIYKCVAFKDGNMYLITSPKYFNTYVSYIADFDVSKIL